MTLAERCSLFFSGENAESAQPDDLALGQRRLQRWQAEPPFDDESVFLRRLASEGLDLSRFAQVLGVSNETLRARWSVQPDWLSELATAYVRQASPPLQPVLDGDVMDFLELVQPLVDQACDRLAAGVAELMGTWKTAPFDPETIEDVLLMNLGDPLLMRLGRTMALELNVARLHGALAGETPEERFQSFIDYLRQPQNAVSLLAEYPVLARQLTICISQWVDVSLEFLARLCADWALIRSRFSPNSEPGLLVDLIGARAIRIAAGIRS